MWRLVLSLVLMPSGIAVLHAETIYDNGAPSHRYGFHSDYDGVDNPPHKSADGFVLSQRSTVIEGVHWWGFYSPNNTPTEPDEFVIRIYNDAGGVPEVSPFATRSVGNVDRTATGNDVLVDYGGSPGTYDEFEYSVAIEPITVDPGTTYWLEIVNNTALDTDDAWRWETTGNFGEGNSANRASDGSQWLSDSLAVDLAFLLVGEVISPGDMNEDGQVNGLDVDPFVYAVLNEPFNLIADMNEDGAVTGLDVDPFVAALLGGEVAAVPEPSTNILATMGVLGIIGCLSRWKNRVA